MSDAGKSEKIVVLAVDLSKQAEDMVEWYGSFLHKAENKVTLLHANEGITLNAAQQSKSEADIKRLIEKDEKDIKSLHEKYDTKLNNLNIKADFKTVHGKPGEAVVDAAADLEASMIVMGTRGLGTIRRTIMGSVSDYVVHHAHCPVIVCRQ